jgi:hypothetical protein
MDGGRCTCHLFGIELIIAGLIVAAGIVTRSVFGRPWIVLATPAADPAGALAWEVKGWRRSGQLIEEVTAELTAGLTPSPLEDTERRPAAIQPIDDASAA